MEFRDFGGNIVKVPKKEEISWRPSVYGILVKDSSMLCVKQRWDEKYSFPGGGIELGEDTIDSLKREFLEETGYEIKVTKKQPAYVKTALFVGPVSKKPYHAIAFYYEVRLISSKQKKAKDFGDGREIKEVCWKKISEIKASEFSYFHRDLLKLLPSK